ncbi:DUF6284 family protein [Streptomyces noursei]|uniref:Uncharacterized protein n=1 Tax=Streptomyces noursei TaxID=1971 RepID=A0A2N8PKR3_STRNR|nr:DUF6284 family protein [Streptomyces noursei]PNE41613.1 hypothetical protein AOB60_13380 [Streptomyces noursei]
MSTNRTARKNGPSQRDLRAITREMPVITAEVEVLDAQIALLNRPPSKVAVRELRHAQARLLKARREATNGQRRTRKAPAQAALGTAVAA